MNDRNDRMERHGASTARRNVFGAGLRALREAHGLTANQVAAALTASGYEIATETYDLLEDGCTLPERAGQLLNLLTVVLNLAPAEARDLSERLAYAILFARLGAHTDMVLPPKADW